MGTWRREGDGVDGVGGGGGGGGGNEARTQPLDDLPK